MTQQPYMVLHRYHYHIYQMVSQVDFLSITFLTTTRRSAYAEGPLSLSPRSSGTNLRAALLACSQEVPGLRTSPAQADLRMKRRL